MKKTRRYIFFTTFLVLLICADAGAPFKKVSILSPTTSATASTSTNEPPTAAANDETKNDNATVIEGPTKNPKLTGIPQIDYIWDPNLPRELHGYNLSNYPFLSTVPPEEDIHFKCDGLHDGFYSSIEYKCQVYHHCVYGIRHDFLCANFTAFDQKTFICHFASDVDCEGSQKYWNRNDDLYMATTTSTTTTTTTEPPPTQHSRRPVRPLRPLRRPINRRPADDYYYDDEEYDEYYDDRFNRRQKHRPRQRKPILEYDDDYDEKRSFDDNKKPRRKISRDRHRDTDELEDEDYDSGDQQRKNDRPKTRTRPNSSKADGRKSISAAHRPNVRFNGDDERRSFTDDHHPVNTRRDKNKSTEPEDPSADTVEGEVHPRTSGSKRRVIGASEKRPTTPIADFDDLDDYERPQANAQSPSSGSDQEDAVDDETQTRSKVKTSPKPPEEFVTSKPVGSSVYARPRTPPRIPRPVPINEKKKFEYPVQKTTATTASPVRAEDEEYYEDEEYDDVAPRHRGHSRRRIIDYEDEAPVSGTSVGGRRRNHNESPINRKAIRKTLRKPINSDKRPVAADEDDETEYEGVLSDERYDNVRSNTRKRPYSQRKRISSRTKDEVDFVDDDYEDTAPRSTHRLRPKGPLLRKNVKKPKPSPISEDDEPSSYETTPGRSTKLRSSVSNVGAIRRKNSSQPRQRPSAQVVSEASVQEDSEKSVDVEEIEPEDVSNNKAQAAATSGRTASVRVVKRPFLPSRGGSPYLPRGLQPVGIALKPLSVSHTTDSTPIDMGAATISGVRLLEHGAPILRDSGIERDIINEPRTTLSPRSPLPIPSSSSSEAHSQSLPNKATLDELYETDYDVTLNDALNPTLKPLSPHPNHHQIHNRHYPSAFESSAPSVIASNSFTNNNNNQTPSNNNNNNNNNNDDNNNYNNNNDNYENFDNQNFNAFRRSLTPSPSLSSSSSPSPSSSQLSSNHYRQPQQQQQQQSQKTSISPLIQMQNHVHQQQKQFQLQLQQQQQLQQHQQQQSSLHNPHNHNHQHFNHDQYHSQQQQQQSQQLHHSQHRHEQLQSHHQQQQQQQHDTHTIHPLNNYNSDSYFSSTDIRRRAIIVPAPIQNPGRSSTDYRGVGTRIAQHFYDDLEY